MNAIDERKAVVAAARSFIGTRYHHHGMIKGAGVDCATFLMLAFTEAGVLPPIDIGKYSNQWHLHHDDPLYEQAIIANGGRVIDEATDVGDIVLFFQGRQFAHGGIISQVSPMRIIHAYAPARMVVEGDLREFGAIAGVDKKFFTTW